MDSADLLLSRRAMGRLLAASMVPAMRTGPALAGEAENPLAPVSFAQVSLRDSFWAPRLETNARVTVPACIRK